VCQLLRAGSAGQVVENEIVAQHDQIRIRARGEELLDEPKEAQGVALSSLHGHT
jgi:hypothetical protein